MLSCPTVYGKITESLSPRQNGYPYPRAHKLIDLLAECEKQGRDFAQFRNMCLIVDQYYIPTRYRNGVPGSLASGLPGDQEAAEPVAAAERLLSFVAMQAH